MFFLHIVRLSSLRDHAHHRQQYAGDVFALTANPDDPTSLGIYTCEAVNCMGRVYSSSKVNIGKGDLDDRLLKSADDTIHTPPPVFTTELKDLKIKLGDTFTLGCQGNTIRNYIIQVCYCQYVLNDCV